MNVNKIGLSVSAFSLVPRLLQDKLTFIFEANVRQNVTRADKEIKRLLGCERCRFLCFP